MMLYPKYVPLLLPTLQGRMCTAALSQTLMNISSTFLVRLVLYIFLVKSMVLVSENIQSWVKMVFWTRGHWILLRIIFEVSVPKRDSPPLFGPFLIQKWVNFVFLSFKMCFEMCQHLRFSGLREQQKQPKRAWFKQRKRRMECTAT